MPTVYPWAFTRIWLQGVCRYLRDVDEAKSPRFFIVRHVENGLNSFITIILNFKYDEKF